MTNRPWILAGMTRDTGDPPVSILRRITNAEFKGMMANYIDLAITPPGNAPKFVQVEQLWLVKNGSDIAPTIQREFIAFSTTSDFIIDSEAAAAQTSGVLTRRYNGYRITPSDWNGEDRYIYVGVDFSMGDINEVAVFVLQALTQVQENLIGAFTRVPGYTQIRGRNFKLWRSNVTWNSLDDWLDQGARNGDELFVDTTGRTLETIADYSSLSVIVPFQDDLPDPLRSVSDPNEAEFAPVYQIPVEEILEPGRKERALAIGGHILSQNQPLQIGITLDLFQGFRPLFLRDSDPFTDETAYLRDLWDEWVAGINDVTISIGIVYRIHNTIQIFQ